MCLNLIRSILIHELTLLIHSSSKVLPVDLGRDGEDIWVVFTIPVKPNLTLPGVREKLISLAPDWTGFSLVLSA